MKTIRLETVDSTNTFVKRYLKDHSLPSCEDGRLLVIADEQTAGRGRTGKTFSSLKDNGLYMTLAVPADKKPKELLMLTPAAAVAVLSVLEEEGCRGLGIKWVNDILDADMKKVCGILTEGVRDPDTGLISYAVIGIGLNAGTDVGRLPEELGNIAGSITVRSGKTELAEKIAGRVSQFADRILAGDREDVLKKYRESSILTGKAITWEQDGILRSGVADSVNDDCNLVVRTEEDTIILNSGMVSVRPAKK